MKLKILMISSEAVPYAKAGGLADVVPTLARELFARGHDVRIVIPRYYFIERRALSLFPSTLDIRVGEKTVHAGFFHGHLKDQAVPIYFVDCEAFFGRDGIYGTQETPDFPDNPSRFTVLNKAALGLCKILDWVPDIVHAHDWPSAPSLAYIDDEVHYGAFRASAGVFTIHNVGYQGLFPAEQFPVLGLPWEEFRPGSFEFFGRLNFMQGALRHAQKITTVSPTYANEIRSPEFGFGMEGILKERQADVSGILNGMDYEEWNPATDSHIAKTYDRESLEDKAADKRALQEFAGLKLDPEIPVMGIISRMVGQKGFVELCAPDFGSLPKILKDFPLQFVVLGTGEKWCEEELTRLSRSMPNLKVFLSYSEKTSHMIQAGCDFFLMPSLYEPCGLTQMYALRYGTVPIVAPTGGLADTVDDLRVSPGTATGIHIALPVSPESIYQAVRVAMHLWKDRAKTLVEMRRRGMKRKFSWTTASEQYEKVYIDAIMKKRASLSAAKLVRPS